MAEITYRPGTLDDAECISKLILDSQRKHCFHEYTEEGQKLMLRLCGVKAIRFYIARDDVYYVALNHGNLVGVVGIRDTNHLAHNFVDDDFHRNGISKELWRLATEECEKRGNKGSYELRASTYAIPVYEKWGFVQTAPTDQEYGITSTPMGLNPE